MFIIGTLVSLAGIFLFFGHEFAAAFTQPRTGLDRVLVMALIAGTICSLGGLILLLLAAISDVTFWHVLNLLVVAGFCFAQFREWLITVREAKQRTATS